VALTFDSEHPDRPSGQGIEVRLLDLLERRTVPATFFIQGRWAEAHPDLARRIADDRHLVGNHSHYHARLPLLTRRGLRSDIEHAERSILAATGVDPRPWFRCPFGSGAADRRVQEVIRAAGYRHVGWHVAADDWEPDRSSADIERRIVDGCLARGDGTVVLLHAWPDRTPAAVDSSIARLSDAGATFVRLDALDAIPELALSIDTLVASA
jgi:peptidoglycan/xylan/chitin deacetylase (PgdA/CDA1 family)